MSANPLFWLHLRVTSPVRTNFYITGTFMFLVILSSGLSYRFAEGVRADEIDSLWAGLMVGAQCLFLIVLGPAAIRKSVQRDFQTGMIESHRVSPMSNLKIVLGYLTGAPVQALMLYAASAVLGSFFMARYAIKPGATDMTMLGLVFGGWIFSQVCLIVLACTVSCCLLVSAIATQGKANILGIMIVIGFMSGWSVLLLVPGIALLTGVMSAGVLFGIVTGVPTEAGSETIIASTILQLALCALLIYAACRKLRRPDRTLFSVPAAFLLCALFAVAFVVGVSLMGQHDWLFQRSSGLGVGQVIFSVAAFGIVGWFALCAAQVEKQELDRAVSFGQPDQPARRRNLGLTPALLGLFAIVVFAALGVVRPYEGGGKFGGSFSASFLVNSIALMLSCWTDASVLYLIIGRYRRVVLSMLFFAAVTKIAPILFAMAMDAYYFSHFASEVENSTEGGYFWAGTSYLIGMSPLGTLMIADEGVASALPGLGWQVFLAIGVAWLAHRAAVKRRATLRGRGNAN